MAFLALIVTLGLVVSVSSEAPSAESCSADGTCGANDVKGSAMLQTSANIESRLEARAAESVDIHEIDGQVAALLRARRANTTDIAEDFEDGIQAVMDSLPFFMEKPPKVKEGMEKLGSELFKAVSKPVQKHFKGKSLTDFKEKWMDFFDQDETEVVSKNIGKFSEKGVSKYLMKSLNDIMDKLSEGVSKLLPEKSGKEIKMLIDGSSDLILAFGDGLYAYNHGEGAEGLSVLTQSFEEAVTEPLPEDAKSSGKQILGKLDGKLTSLGQTVVDFQRKLVQERACWKNNLARNSTAPSVCPEGWTFDGEKFCRDPEKLALRQKAIQESLNSMDGSLKQKKPPKSVVIAGCDPAGDFTDKIGHQCYTPCPPGYAKGPEGKKCKTVCEGSTPYDGGSMCGVDKRAVKEAMNNMRIATDGGEKPETADDILAKVKEMGTDATPLKGLMGVFAGMKVPYKYKKCSA